MRLFIPLIGSAITLGIGGLLLLGKVPLILSLGTLIGVSLFLLSSYLIYKNSKIGIYLGLFLSVLAIISSSSSTAHIETLFKFGSSIYISVLDILMVLGFYIFPIFYIILFAKRLKSRM